MKAVTSPRHKRRIRHEVSSTICSSVRFRVALLKTGCMGMSKGVMMLRFQHLIALVIRFRKRNGKCGTHDKELLAGGYDYPGTLL